MSSIVTNHRVTVEEPGIAKLFLSDTRFAVVWLVIRLYVGYQWLMAGYEKLISPAWTGDKAGSAMAGFVAGALKLTTGDHPSVAGWYATFLSSVVLPNTVAWSWAITLGEMAVGVGLILGLLTGIAAFFGGLMNANYLLSGTVSTNPLLFIFATWLVLAWRVAGYYGLDYYLLPYLGVPGHPGKAFVHQTAKPQFSRVTT
jgi:thiosulfate dehydrogenase [quinone] large subunit